MLASANLPITPWLSEATTPTGWMQHLWWPTVSNRYRRRYKSGRSRHWKRLHLTTNWQRGQARYHACLPYSSRSPALRPTRPPNLQSRDYYVNCYPIAPSLYPHHQTGRAVSIRRPIPYGTSPHSINPSCPPRRSIYRASTSSTKTSISQINMTVTITGETVGITVKQSFMKRGAKWKESRASDKPLPIRQFREVDELWSLSCNYSVLIIFQHPDSRLLARGYGLKFIHGRKVGLTSASSGLLQTGAEVQPTTMSPQHSACRQCLAVAHPYS